VRVARAMKRSSSSNNSRRKTAAPSQSLTAVKSTAAATDWFIADIRHFAKFALSYMVPGPDTMVSVLRVRETHERLLRVSLQDRELQSCMQGFS